MYKFKEVNGLQYRRCCQTDTLNSDLGISEDKKFFFNSFYFGEY